MVELTFLLLTSQVLLRVCRLTVNDILSLRVSGWELALSVATLVRVAAIMVVGGLNLEMFKMSDYLSVSRWFGGSHIQPLPRCFRHHHQTRPRCRCRYPLGKKSTSKATTVEIGRDNSQTSSAAECCAKAETRGYCVNGTKEKIRKCRMKHAALAYIRKANPLKWQPSTICSSPSSSK